MIANVVAAFAVAQFALTCAEWFVGNHAQTHGQNQGFCKETGTRIMRIVMFYNMVLGRLFGCMGLLNIYIYDVHG